nr:SEL1-like repeat protein [Eubacterium sp.]
YERCIENMTEEAESYVAGPVLLRLGNMYLNGEGTEKNTRTALACYQSAERFLYSMVVDDGNYMYKKSLKQAIEGQEKARAEMAKMMDGKEWKFD